LKIPWIHTRLVHVAGLKENKLPRNCLTYLLIILFQRIKFPNEWVKGELNDPENLAEWRVGDESEFLEDFKEGSWESWPAHLSAYTVRMLRNNWTRNTQISALGNRHQLPFWRGIRWRIEESAESSARLELLPFVKPCSLLFLICSGGIATFLCWIWWSIYASSPARGQASLCRPALW